MKQGKTEKAVFAKLSTEKVETSAEQNIENAKKLVERVNVELGAIDSLRTKWEATVKEALKLKQEIIETNEQDMRSLKELKSILNRMNDGDNNIKRMKKKEALRKEAEGYYQEIRSILIKAEKELGVSVPDPSWFQDSIPKMSDVATMPSPYGNDVYKYRNEVKKYK